MYGGDSHFIGSSSSALSETVNRDSTATSVSGSSNPVTAGQTETLTATVTLIAGRRAFDGDGQLSVWIEDIGDGDIERFGAGDVQHIGRFGGSHIRSRRFMRGMEILWGADRRALSLTVAQNGTGLLGEYFSDMNLTTPDLLRIDPTVNFNWNNNSPDSSLAMTGYSAKWTGTVEAQYSETYTFYKTSDDGARLWVNGQEPDQSMARPGAG